MGACGCGEGNAAFKLKAPDGRWYVIELQPGCDYCSHGPGLCVLHPDMASYLGDDLDFLPELPWLRDEHKCAMFKCGPSAEEVKHAAVKCFGGTDIKDDDVIDGALAEILGEDIWKDYLTGSPELIEANTTRGNAS